ncbi:MAG: nickel-dependent lactate racemase [Nitrospinota bacterium]
MSSQVLKKVCFPYGDETRCVEVPESQLLDVISPRDVPHCGDTISEIRRCLASPIDSPPLSELAKGRKNAVLACDDLTRPTPAHLILPAVLEELNSSGLSDEQITILIALGTHRPMTEEEIVSKFGEQVVRQVRVVNHAWDDPNVLVDLGKTKQGTPIEVNRMALGADLLIGVGCILPHHIPGYSGGAKIIQPGVCGGDTTGETHLLSVRLKRSMLGKLENPVRAEMETIAEKVGLDAIINVVVNRQGDLVHAVYGDFRQAYREGVRLCHEIYAVPCSEKAEIVLASSSPCNLEFWQAHKTLYPADAIAADGGTLVVVTPCPEGVAKTHSEMLEIAGKSSAEIDRMARSGEIPDLPSAALALAWAQIRERVHVILVSDGIGSDEAAALGFDWAPSPQEGLERAMSRYAYDARVHIMTHAPETVPVLP